MKYKHYTLAFAAITAALSAQTENSHPATESEELVVLPTVYVTGDLWESELEKTTASVSVIDSSSLELKASQHFDDLVNSVPNLTWTGATSRPRYFQIRGIGENSQFEGETPDSSVRFLIDDFDLTGLGTVANLFDTQQVEVLRGPQAGSFGANAAGGVVRVVTNQPTPYWTGQVETTVGSDSLMSGGVAIGGPLLPSDPEQLTFRFSMHQLFQDGFRDNAFLNRDDTNQRDELSSQLKVRWIASPDWQWDAGLLYADADNGYDEFSLDNTRFDTFSDEPGEDDQRTIAGSLRGTWTGLNSVDVTTVSTYTVSDSDYSYDADWTDAADPRSYDGFLATVRDREVMSQEIRFDSAEKEDALGWIDRWTFGVYYHSLEEDTALSYEDIYAPGTLTSTYQAETYAAFGQIAHDFSESTRIILGLRYEKHKADFSSTTIDDYFGSLIPGTNRSSNDNDLFGGKLTLEHDLNADQMLFASVTRGYKAGGVNSGAFRSPGDPLTYGNEVLWNYELGLRSSWWDGALTSSVTAFYLERSDSQFRDSAGSGGFFRYLTVNGEDAHHYGVEGEMTWYVNTNWKVFAGLGLLHTERESYNDNGTFVDSRKVANAPLYNYQLGAEYTAGNGFFATTEIQGKDAYYESNSHNEERSAFMVLNASIGYRLDNWTFTLWAHNLLDEDYEKRVFYFGNEEPAYADKRYEDPADPRQFGITANYSF